MCTIIIAVPKGRSAQQVALELRANLRPTVFDATLVEGLGGYRPLEFSVAERGKEVHMTIRDIGGREEMTVFGRVKDSLYSHQLECTFQAPMAKAA